MSHYSLAPANFEDYRDYLRCRFEELKSKNPRFSLQRCADKSKVSKSLLQFMFNKQRHISLDKVSGIGSALRLKSDEEYFVCLMLCAQTSQSAEVKSHFSGILSRIRNQYVKVEMSAPESADESHKFLHLDPLLSVIQALTRLPEFNGSSEWILRTLNIPGLTEERITSSLRRLEEKQFLRRGQSGELVAEPDKLWRPDPFDPSGFQVYSIAARFLADLMKTPHIYRPSVYMSMSISLNEANLIFAEKLMIELHHKLQALERASVNPTAVAFFGNFYLTLARLHAKPQSF